LSSSPVSRTESRRASIASGVSAYLTKPIDTRQLQAAIGLAAARRAEFEQLEASRPGAAGARGRKLVERARTDVRARPLRQDAFVGAAHRERNRATRRCRCAHRRTTEPARAEAKADGTALSADSNGPATFDVRRPRRHRARPRLASPSSFDRKGKQWPRLVQQRDSARVRRSLPSSLQPSLRSSPRRSRSARSQQAHASTSRRRASERSSSTARASRCTTSRPTSARRASATAPVRAVAAARHPRQACRRTWRARVAAPARRKRRRQASGHHLRSPALLLVSDRRPARRPDGASTSSAARGGCSRPRAGGAHAWLTGNAPPTRPPRAYAATRHC
jgi:hypothetical protein